MSVAAAKQRVIYPASISAPGPHETARAVVRVLVDPKGKGPKKNAPTKEYITEAELKQVTEIIKAQQSGKSQLGLTNVPELRRADALDRVKELDRFWHPMIVGENDRAGYSAIAIDAFWSPEHREVAKLVAERFGNLPIKDRVDSGAIERAHGLLGDRKSLFNQLPGAADIQNFDQRLTEIRDFMNNGRSGLCNHGPVNIYGEIFGQVFRLPFLPAYPPPPPGPDEERNPALYNVLDDTITEYEERFKETGYDRVYIAGQDGRLYLAIRDKGGLDEVQRGAEATFTSKSLTEASAIGHGVAPDSQSLLRNSGRPAQIGQVLRTINVPNNVREAATSWGRNLLLRSVRSTQEQANQASPLVAMRNGPPGIVPARVGGTGNRPDGIWDQLKRVGFLASFAAIPGLAGVTGGYFTGQGLGTWAAVVGLVTAATGVGTVLTQVIEQRITPRNTVAFLSAAGMTTQRKRVRADDI